MAYSVSYTPSAAKTLKKMDRTAALQIIGAIEKLKSDPCPAGHIQLKCGSGELRVRTGDSKIIYEVNERELIILVLKVGHRREIYRAP